MSKQFLGRIHKLGLGFARRENGGEKKRRKRKCYARMKENGYETLLYMQLGRVDPNPTRSSHAHSRLIQILMDLDQSNAPGALA